MKYGVRIRALSGLFFIVIAGYLAVLSGSSLLVPPEELHIVVKLILFTTTLFFMLLAINLTSRAAGKSTAPAAVSLVGGCVIAGLFYDLIPLAEVVKLILLAVLLASATIAIWRWRS